MFLSKPFLEQPLFQVEERLLVLGKDDQPLVVTELAVGKEVLLDPADQSFGLGVGLLGKLLKLARVFDGVSVVAEGFQGLIDLSLQVLGRLTPAAEVGTGVAGGILFQDRPLVVTLALFFCPFRRHPSHVEEAAAVRFRLPLQVPPPRPGEGERA